jgi:hypothetical protein
VVKCPKCNSSDGFALLVRPVRESTGELFYDDMMICEGCGAEFKPEDLELLTEETDAPLS